MFDRFSSFLFLSVYILFYTVCCQSCVAPSNVIQVLVSLILDSLLAFRFACEQAPRDALAVRPEKEGQLPTTSLEFEYLHRKSRCEMLIDGDDISNDVITLGMCFTMFVYIRARFRFALSGENLRRNSRDVVTSSPSFSRPAARPPESHGELGRWLVELGFRISIVKGIPDFNR